MLAALEKILFAAAFALALFLALKEIRRKFRLIASGRPVARFERPLQRIGEMLWKVLFQVPVISRRPVTGLFHALIFWGFFVFALVTFNHTVEGLFPRFNPYGTGMLYRMILFGANLFAGLIIVAVLYFLIRRYIFRPSGLDLPSYPSLIVLTFIFVLMVSFLYYEAFKMVTTGPHTGANFLAHLAFRTLPSDLAPAAILFWGKFLWWLHILTVMAFGVFIFHSKHLHLIAGPLNLVFKNRGVKADLPLVNLEEAQTFGTPRINDLHRKDLLDLFSCAECGRCDDVCPALNSGKVLSPKKLLEKLKEHLLASEKTLATGGELRQLFGDVISEEELWDCTTCAACMEVCPMLNEHVPKIIGMRQNGVLAESRFPEEFNPLFRGIENQGNPWGISADSRSDWAGQLGIPLLSEKGETDILLWVGCAGSYDQHAQKILRALVEIMQRAGLDFAYLGNAEKCCGDPLRRSGMEYLFQIMARQNIETLRQVRFRRIITACPHGLHVLKNEYPKLGGQYEVLHHSQLISKLLANGKIRLKKNGGRVTFHDPCYLGRYNQIYDAPRRVVESVPGAKLKEMKLSRRTSFCCGAGGGGMWKEEKVGERISHVRLRQAQTTGAATLATACPFCSIMFKDAIAETESKNIRTLDIAQIVRENLV